MLEEKRDGSNDTSSDESDNGNLEAARNTTESTKAKADSTVLSKLLGENVSAMEKPSIEEMGE